MTDDFTWHDKPTKHSTSNRARLDSRLRLAFKDRRWLLGRDMPALAFGRGADNDLVVESDYVSRQHGRIEYRHSRFYLTDMSTNGSYVTRHGMSVLYIHDETVLLEGRGGLQLGDQTTDEIEFAVELRDDHRDTWRQDRSSESSTPVSPTDANVFRREGEYWTIGYNASVVRLKDSRGLRFIAYLLGDPGREFHVLDLALIGVPGHAAKSELTSDAAMAQSMRISQGAEAVPMLDAAAKAAYRARVGELREELADAERLNDIGAVDRAREELEFLEDQLAAAVGLGGRDRQTGADAERARVMVTLRIKDAMKKIKQCHATLAHHLSTTIKTGRYCSYEPGPAGAPAWQL